MTIDRIHPLIPFFGIIDHMEEDRNLRLGYRLEIRRIILLPTSCQLAPVNSHLQ